MWRWLVLSTFLLASIGCRSEREAPATRSSARSSQRAVATVSTPRSCSRATSGACAVTEYCDDPHGLCGSRDDLPGVCRLRPTTCTEVNDPVCACDGKIYQNPCTAHAAGMDERLHGGCAEGVPGSIACGPRFCDAKTTYCEIVLSDVAELPSDFTCKVLPEACAKSVKAGNPSCHCLPKATRCANFCVVAEAGNARGLRLTCVGGY